MCILSVKEREIIAVRLCLYRECNILYHSHDVQSIRWITEVHFDHMDTNASKYIGTQQ